MIIKKFLGKTESDAVESAQKELGSGIVIMNVKTVKGKGLFALFGSKQVEVTVALEEEKEALERAKYSNVRQLQKQSADFTSNISSNNAGSNVAKVKDDSAIEKKLDSLQTLLETQFKNVNDKKDESIKEERIQTKEKEEDKADEAVKEEKNDEAADESKEQEKFIKLIYNTLLDNEVDSRIADEILDEIDKIKKPNIPLDYLLASIYQKMILKFGKTDGITPSDAGPKVVIFLGPTGVGKTTTIAKVASNYCMEEKKRVALLTADTYRIAAAEQLRTYANILEVPFRVIYTGEEIKEAINDFREYDYIFVDTAGHSHQNDEQLQAMKELIDAVDSMTEKDVFLVLSATTKYRDLLSIAESYKQITKFQLIFTKLDETSGVGNLLNIKMKTDSPIAYITCGQNVPDDIEQFNAQKTVKQLLGGK